VVWVPKRGGAEKDVPQATRLFDDARARHYWDEGGRLMAAFTRRLGLRYDAWDVYFVYGPEARWEGADPPSPDYWMQMAGVAAPAFDGKGFAREALARLPSTG
jgi:hypothetical protein